MLTAGKITPQANIFSSGSHYDERQKTACDQDRKKRRQPTIRQITIDLLDDRSMPEEFRFSLRCAECGRERHSTPVRFSKAGVRPETQGKHVIFRTLYEREREQERQRAAESAARSFNLCPICGRLVCGRCFLICDDLDLCTACARRLNECGTPIRDADGVEL